MTRHFKNRTKDHPENYTSYINVGDHGFEKKNKEANFIEPTTDPLQTWTVIFIFQPLWILALTGYIVFMVSTVFIIFSRTNNFMSNCLHL